MSLLHQARTPRGIVPVERRFALLLSGAPKPGQELNTYSDEVERFRAYLHGQVGIPQRNMIHLSGLRCGLDGVLDTMHHFFSVVANGDRPSASILVYSGHGTRSGMAMNEDDISYWSLARMVPGHVQTLFLNSTCYSGAAIHAFRWAGLLSRSLVITSTSAWKTSNETHLDDARCAVSKGEVLHPDTLGLVYLKGQIIVERAPSTPDICTEDGIEFVLDLPTIREVTFDKPRVIGRAYWPKRAGQNLDYLLFPD